VHLRRLHLSGCSEGCFLLMPGEPGSKGQDAMASMAGASPARAGPSVGLVIFMCLPSQHLCCPLLQPVGCDGPHAVSVRKIASSDFKSPSTWRLVPRAQDVRWGGIRLPLLLVTQACQVGTGHKPFCWKGGKADTFLSSFYHLCVRLHIINTILNSVIANKKVLGEKCLSSCVVL